MLTNLATITLGCTLALTYATPQPAEPPSLAGWAVECIQNRYHQCFVRRVATPLPPARPQDLTMVSASRMGQEFFLLFTTPLVTHSVLTVVTDDGRVEHFVKTGCSAQACHFGGLFDASLGERIMSSQWLYVEGDYENHPGAEMIVDLTGLRAAVYGLR